MSLISKREGAPSPADAHRFDYAAMPEGYYQHVVESGNPVRRAWHLQEFGRVLESLPRLPGQSILDVGCFAGTFLSLLPQETFSVQVGVDILERQIEYATRRFGTSYRSFAHIRHVADLSLLGRSFDCVTLTEVIEHLTEEEIREFFEQVRVLLKPGGTLVLSTPNYTSLWPLWEFVVNRVSDVTYEQQHITKFNYFTCLRKLTRIYPGLLEDFTVNFKTTTHFIAPFLAAISLKWSMWLSRSVSHRRWKNPFGNIILLSFQKN